MFIRGFKRLLSLLRKPHKSSPFDLIPTLEKIETLKGWDENAGQGALSRMSMILSQKIYY